MEAFIKKTGDLGEDTTERVDHSRVTTDGSRESTTQLSYRTPSRPAQAGGVTGAAREQEPRKQRQCQQMRKEEAKAFSELGSRLDRMHAIVSDARNIHKTLRDALTESVLLYQQMADSREAISTINTAMERENRETQGACYIDSKRRPVTTKKDRHVQTTTCVNKSIAVQTDGKDKGK